MTNETVTFVSSVDAAIVRNECVIGDSPQLVQRRTPMNEILFVHIKEASIKIMIDTHGAPKINEITTQIP